MSLEYHGWLALASSQSGWSDENFREGYERVVRALERLPRDEGHEEHLPECDVLPRVAYLKGSQVESLDIVFDVVKEVATIFDLSYGELAVFDGADLAEPWDASRVSRYSLVEGELRGRGR